jgi:hypothetical protein
MLESKSKSDSNFIDFYFYYKFENIDLKMLEPSLGRMSIRMEMFFMFERRLSLFMKLILYLSEL